MTRITRKEAERMGIPPEMLPPRNKYGNERTQIDGEWFDSIREANAYQVLLLRQTAGEVRNIKRQVSYPLEVGGSVVGTYIADFVYEELRDGVWHTVVEDAKGYATREYKLKRKLMRAVWGVEIREV